MSATSSNSRRTRRLLAGTGAVCLTASLLPLTTGLAFAAPVPITQTNNPPAGGTEIVVFPQRDFVTATGFARLADVARALEALDVRLRRLPDDPARDRLWTVQVARVQAEVDDVARRVPASPELERVRWMVEELRISLFAQPMRTRGPVSEKRILKALDALLS